MLIDPCDLMPRSLSSPNTSCLISQLKQDLGKLFSLSRYLCCANETYYSTLYVRLCKYVVLWVCSRYDVLLTPAMSPLAPVQPRPRWGCCILLLTSTSKRYNSCLRHCGPLSVIECVRMCHIGLVNSYMSPYLGISCQITASSFKRRTKAPAVLWQTRRFRSGPTSSGNVGWS